MLSALHIPSGLLFSESVAFFVSGLWEEHDNHSKKELKEDISSYITLKIIISSLIFHAALFI